MKLVIEIKMDNAAFEDGNNGPEVARILRKFAVEVQDGSLMPGFDESLRDINGNTVGNAEVFE